MALHSSEPAIEEQAVPGQPPLSQWTLFRRPASFGWLDAIILVALVIAFLAPRLASLGRFVTADEPTWGKRAASFYYALADGDFANTYQTGHPGVTTMWAGALAYRLKFPQYRDVGQVELGDTKLLQIFQNRGINPLVLLAIARTNIVFIILFTIVFSYIFAWRLFGRWLATVGFLLIAFEPFYLAHARFLHTNGMLASFMFLSVLAYLDYMQSRKWYSLAVSGAAAGLSFITITPGFNLIPAVFVLTLFSLGSGGDRIRDLKIKDWASRLVLPLALWGGISLLTIFIVWPAMWVKPMDTLLNIMRYTLSAAEGEIGGAQFVEAYEAAGEDRSSYAYFYPLTYLWRTTPIILAGLVLVGVTLIVPKTAAGLGVSVRRNLLLLLVYVAVYTLVMGLGSKKFDRYYLPAYLPLDMMSAAGWLALASWLAMRFTAVRKYALQYILLVGVVALQALGTIRTAPYYLTYYNPLLGGIRKAPAVMSIGWGEGLNEAALYLKSKPGFCDKRIISWYTNAYNWYSVSFGCDAKPVEFRPETTLEEYLSNYDYAVIYINQRQRNFPPQLLEYLDRQPPEHSVWIDGVEYARIYRLNPQSTGSWQVHPPLNIRLTKVVASH